MSTVNTEGKLNWYLGIELSLRSLGAYLQLGLSLGAVQLRHACVPAHLAAYHATCLWRRRVTGTPEDGVLYLEGEEEEEANVKGSIDKDARREGLKSSCTAAKLTASRAVIITRPVAAQVSGPVSPHAFLAELLAKFDAVAAITHGEAADVKLLTRMMQQDLLVRQHRAAQRAAGVRVHGPSASDAQQRLQQHPSEDNVVFRMSESDATYASLVNAGHPTAITYRNFVVLTNLLSEALAWDLLWIHEAMDRQAKADATSTEPTVTPPPLQQQQRSSLASGACDVEADCVAVMLPNSVEYNAIWMAAARSGPLHTFLDVLYRNSNHIIGSGNRGGTYRPCRTALLNTNLASNAMLYHAIECSGSVMLLLDAAFVPLLFCTRDASAEATAPTAELTDEQVKETQPQLQLHVPPHVKRIYLWRSAKSNGEPLLKGMTKEMELLLCQFNAHAYGADAEQAAKKPAVPSLDPAERAAEATRQPPLPTPPLDLFESIKPFYTRAQVTPSFTVTEMRHTYLISSPQARLLVQHILARPPPGWASLLALEQPSIHTTPVRATAAAEAAGAHQLPQQKLKAPQPQGASPPRKKPVSAPKATAADSAQSRTQLERYKVKMASILSVLLRRFHHTQPVLFIYTSGTTGLPKAARFSHLRFFATGFLSRVLYYRERIAETVVEQREEAAYVAAHPDAVREYLLANSTAFQENAATTARATPAPSSPKSTVMGTVEAASDAADTPQSRAGANTEHDGRCPPLPQIFGAKILNPTRHKRNTVEATLVIICNVALWWVRYFASFVGLEYYVCRAAERYWYTPDALAAVEDERRLVTIYNCLPMYHTVGSVFCLGHLLHALEEQQYAWAQLTRCTRHEVAYLEATVPTVRMVLRSKFSASQFRRDLQRYHVTVVQYIGEVLRYAVLYERSHAPPAVATGAATAAPAAPAATEGHEGLTKKQRDNVTAATKGDLGSDSSALSPALAEALALAAANRTSWRVPYAFGNGLRQDIWLECMRRLNLAHPVEFYSSTEGNIFLLNLFGMPGVVGHIPRFPPPIAWLSMQYFPLFPFRVLKFDEDAQQVYRDPRSGYCAHCPVGEVGEVVGEVIEGFDMFALRRFDGYHKAKTRPTTTTPAAAAEVAGTADQEEDAAARQSKVIRHVLWPYTRDCYFLSGDLIRMDRYGFCSFVDRVGDTFRWKGENVSTLEVSNALNSIHTTRVGVQEAVVYGVQLPGREGRAGMAMLRLQRSHIALPKTTAAVKSIRDDATADCSRDGNAASMSSSPAPSVHAVTLHEERVFLQNDLYAFLTGKVTRNGDGSANQATLPPYAIPLFVRMQDALPAEDDDDHDADEARDERENDGESESTAALTATSSPSTQAPSSAAAHAGAAAARKDEHEDNATQTTTFKYKRGVLIKQSYDFEGSSAALTSDEAVQGWGEKEKEAGSSREKGSAATSRETSTPFTRVYVLVTNPAVFKALAVHAETAEDVAAPPFPTISAGYVPLTPATRKILGENMEKCGW